MIYIQFYTPPTFKKEKKSFLLNCFIRLVTTITPSANPDYDGLIDKATTWLLEFENKNDYPTREVGLDKDGKVILKMPYNKNYGYWTDNNMKYQDFISHFDAKELEHKHFNDKWNEI